MTNEELDSRLRTLAEPAYRDFSGKLLPPQARETLLGVRLPVLRCLAKEFSRGDWRGFLRSCQDDCFEKVMLQGMVIGCAKAEPEETLACVENFLPKINNWSVCDSFCAGLKRLAAKEPARVWRFVLPYVADEREYYARFGIVMLLQHFTAQPYAADALTAIDGIKSTAYYARMAAAWAVSVYQVHCPELTAAYLRHCRLDDFTYNKAIQKITESYRVPQKQKEELRRWKRKVTSSVQRQPEQ